MDLVPSDDSLSKLIETILLFGKSQKISKKIWRIVWFSKKTTLRDETLLVQKPMPHSKNHRLITHPRT